MKSQSNNKIKVSIDTQSKSDFLFKSNEKYINYKLNQISKPLFFIPKNSFPIINYVNLLKYETNISCISVDTNESDKNENNKNEHSSFPLLKKNFFHNENKNQQNNVQIKSYLFNFSLN